MMQRVEMKEHHNIALFTDFGHKDAYVAQLKGAILSINPNASLIDLSHEIAPFNIRQAAYLLEQSTRFLPAATIVVAVIDPGVGSERNPIVLQTEAGKFYIGPDNGLFTCVVQSEKLATARVLRDPSFFLNRHVSMTFHGRDIFAPVAAHVSLGVSLQAFGPSLTDLVLLPLPQPKVESGAVYGEVIHIDHYGNITTNITVHYLDNLHIGEQVEITLASSSYHIPFCSTYSDAEPEIQNSEVFSLN